jgi:PAS domain S-box-containing protein
VDTEDISRLFLTTLLSIAPDAIIAVDQEHRIMTFNVGAESVFGWGRNEVLGQPLDVLMPERFRTTHTDNIHQFGTAPEAARLMGQRGEIIAQHRDGHEFPAEAAICKILRGGTAVTLRAPAHGAHDMEDFPSHADNRHSTVVASLVRQSSAFMVEPE